MVYSLGANSDIGYQRKLQEDYIAFKEYGNDILAVIADGTGTSDNRLQPAVVVVNSIIKEITEVITEQKELFYKNKLFFLKRALLNANNLLGIMKIANEEMYYGYCASVSVCYLDKDGGLYYCHSGNTRIYIMRGGKLNLLTEDHTVAMQRVYDGEITMQQYYITDDRLRLTSGIGLQTEPTIYEKKGRIKPNDIIVLTTDGVHYALTDDNITNIILQSENVVDAAEKLVFTAKELVKYPDNMSAFVIGSRS